MAERHQRRLRWQAGRPLRIGGLTLLPIEQIAWNAHAGRSGAWFAASKEPVAIVVHDAGDWRAVSPDGSELAIDALRERVPDLDAALAAI